MKILFHFSLLKLHSMQYLLSAPIHFEIGYIPILLTYHKPLLRINFFLISNNVEFIKLIIIILETKPNSIKNIKYFSIINFSLTREICIFCGNGIGGCVIIPFP